MGFWDQFTQQEQQEQQESLFSNELNSLKTEINNNNSPIIFKWVEQFSSNEDIWVYFRVERYDKDINKYAQKYWIPSKYLFALTTTESKWNPTSINATDSWAGIIHFQPDVAKQYWLRVFTDTEPYKKYAVDLMKTQINKKTWKKRKKAEIYAKHAKILKWVLKIKWKASLWAFDERFNHEKCLDAACKYLKYIRENYVDKYYNKHTSHVSWDKYKTNEEDFKRKLTLNGFNKWPLNFAKRFESWTHVANINKHIKNKEYYDNKILILKNRGFDQKGIIEKLEYPFFPVKMKNWDESREYFKYEWESLNKDTISINFDNRDREYKSNLYKNTGTNNITKIWNKTYIKAKKISKSNIEADNKNPFKHIRISNDWKYNIYSYTIKNGWNYWWVLNQFLKNNWTLEGTIVTNDKWNEFPKNQSFKKNEKVYIKEKIKT